MDAIETTPVVDLSALLRAWLAKPTAKTWRAVIDHARAVPKWYVVDGNTLYRKVGAPRQVYPRYGGSYVGQDLRRFNRKQRRWNKSTVVFSATLVSVWEEA